MMPRVKCNEDADPIGYGRKNSIMADKMAIKMDKVGLLLTWWLGKIMTEL